jgi:hypothetical protein
MKGALCTQISSTPFASAVSQILFSAIQRG